MTSSNWLRALSTKLFASPRSHRRAVPAGESRKRPLRVEALEGRLAPASFVVTNLLGDASGGTLFNAIANANSNQDTYNTITFSPGLAGTIGLFAPQNDAASLGRSFFVVSKNLTINGPSDGYVQLSGQDGAPASRFFTVTTGAHLTLSNLTLAEGRALGGKGGDSLHGSGGGAAGLGGAILNYGGVLTINGVTFANNQAIGGDGGSTASSQSSGGGGGGLGGSASSFNPADPEQRVAGGPNGGDSPRGNGQNGSPATGPGGGGGSGVQSTVDTEDAGAGAAGGFGGGGGGGGNAYAAFLPAGYGGGGGRGGFGGGGGGGGSSLGGVPKGPGDGGQPGFGGGPGTGGTNRGGYGGGGAGLGGAIFSEGGFTTITNSTFVNNVAVGGHGNNNNNGGGYGGGVFVHNGYLQATNTTFANNVAAADGAGIQALTTGGSTNTTLVLFNSLFANPSSRDVSVGSPDGGNASIYADSNLFRVAPSFPASFTHSIITTSPGLGTFGDHGGPAPTVQLLPGSPALDAANPTLLPAGGTDQRGLPRVANGAPDVGADERQLPVITAAAGSGQTALVGTAFAAPLQVRLMEDGLPAARVSIQFSAASGATSGRFTVGTASVLTAVVATDSDGYATSPAFTAGSGAGSYAVTATALDGVGATSFSLTNRQPTASAGGPYSSAEGSALTLSASSELVGAVSYVWAINGHANAVTGAQPTLTWEQLKALGIEEGPATFPISVEASNGAQLATGAGTLALSNAGPNVTLNVPATAVRGRPVRLTAAVADPSSADNAAGFNSLWQINEGSGQTLLTGQGLGFTGSNPMPLPNNFLRGVFNLTADVFFSTTQGGVILGYQNQPTSATPTSFVPALYVGTDGKLYGAMFDGTFRQLKSATAVNDGRLHHAVLSASDGQQSLTLDGALIGTLAGTLTPLDMTVNQLGTGYTGGAWPATTSGYFPFVGTLNNVQIRSGNSLAGTVAFPVAGSSIPLDFTPPNQRTYDVSLLATDRQGGAGAAGTSLNGVAPTVTVSVGGDVTLTQGATLSRAGSFIDTGESGPWSATVNYGDGSGTQPLALNADHSFALSHTYTLAGSFTAAVMVTNRDGLVGQGSFHVAVPGFTINDGSTGEEPTPVHSLTVAFETPVRLDPGAFELTRMDGGAVALAIAPSADQTTYVITFAGPAVIDGTLARGEYSLTQRHEKIHALDPTITVLDEDDGDTFTSIDPAFAGTRSQQLVNRLFRDLLGRSADAQGLTTWGAMLDGGVRPEQVVAGILASAESRGRVVDAAYERLLGRTADAAGRAGWVAYLGNGGTAAGLERQLLASGEYAARHATGDDFARAVYHDALGRDAGDGEAAARAAALSGGLSRAQLIDSVFASDEARGHRVEGAYGALLGRQADAAGKAGLVAALGQGLPDAGLLAALAGSSEYSTSAAGSRP